MQLTLNIDLSNTKALALLNYIKTLDFISFEEEIKLTEEQKQFIDIGIEAIKQGKIYKHEDVIAETKKRYPNLFQ